MDFNFLYLIGNVYVELFFLLIIRLWKVLYVKIRYFWNLYVYNQNLFLDLKFIDNGKVIKFKKNVSFSGIVVSYIDLILFDKREIIQFLKF